MKTENTNTDKIYSLEEKGLSTREMKFFLADRALQKVKYEDTDDALAVDAIMTAMEEYSNLKFPEIKELQEKVKKLEFMVENGLGPKDMDP